MRIDTDFGLHLRQNCGQLVCWSTLSPCCCSLLNPISPFAADRAGEVICAKCDEITTVPAPATRFTDRETYKAVSLLIDASNIDPLWGLLLAEPLTTLLCSIINFVGSPEEKTKKFNQRIELSEFVQ